MFTRIEFFISETFISLRRHPAMAFAATVCVAAALFVTGLIGLIVLNGNFAIDNQMDRVRFNVFFLPETSRDQAQSIFERISKLEGVDPEVTVFVPREDALKQQLDKDPELAQLLEGRNPYPDAVKVKANNINDIPRLAAEINSWPEIDKKFSGTPPTTSTSFLVSSKDAIRSYGSIAGLILIILSLVIIHHTIELTLYARRKEINIMSMVGATPSTVAFPFLLEGILYGLFGAGMAIGFLWPMYEFLSSDINKRYGAALLQDPRIMSRGILALIVAGMALGLFGSLISVIKYLRRPRSKMTNA